MFFNRGLTFLLHVRAHHIQLIGRRGSLFTMFQCENFCI
jgi:hypothetical protein